MIDAARTASSTDMRVLVEAVICDRCEALCWSVAVWGHDIAGTGERACWSYRTHIAMQSTALAWAGKVLASSAARLLEAEARQWALEHQLTLDLEAE